MARKFQCPEPAPTTPATAAYHLRLATIQLAGLRVLPRAQPAPMRRWRLPVLLIPTPAEPVKIGHVLQNLGSAVSGTQPIQSRRV